LLRYLSEELRASRVLVIASRRPADAEASREDDGILETLHLDPLSREETALLVNASLGTGKLPPTFYAWVHDATQGMPGAVQQLLRHLVDDGVLLWRDGEWKPSLPSLARSLEDRSWERILTLPDALREVMEAAAALAEPFPLDLLAQLLGEDSQAVYEWLARLVDQGHLERRRETGGALYHVAQRRIRQALYAHLAEDRRRSLHALLGGLLEARMFEGSGLETQVAEHFWRAGEKSRSLPYLLRAAEQASQVYAYAQAASYLGRAAEAAAEQAVSIARDGKVRAHNGSEVTLSAETLCLHGDNPGAVRNAQAVREALLDARIELRALAVR